MNADWGDVPSWVEAVSTSLALIAASVAVAKSSTLLGIERTRDTKRDEAADQRRAADEQAAQADAVAAWVDWFQADSSTSRLDRMRLRGWVIVVVNTSPLPIYDFMGTLAGRNGIPLGRVSRSLLPTGKHTLEFPSGAAPKEQHEFETAREMRVAIEFRDTAGRQWKRDRHGQLTKTGEVRFVDASDGAAATNDARAGV